MLHAAFEWALWMDALLGSPLGFLSKAMLSSEDYNHLFRDSVGLVNRP